MDAPERDQGAYGDRATAALAEMAPHGTQLSLERDVEARDRYGRVLGYLWVQRGDSMVLLNWLMVRRGYALAYTYPPNVQYAEWFARAQEEARREGAGLWSDDAFRCSPADFRAGRCGA